MTNLRKIILISKPLYRGFALVSALILLEAMLAQAYPILIKLMVDQIELQVAQQSGDLNRLLLYLGLFFLANIFGELLTSVSQRVGDFVASRLGKFLTERFYEKIFTLPQTYFDSELSGKIVNQLTRGIQTIQDFVSASTNFILPAIAQSIFTLAVLAYFDLTVAILAASLFPFYVGVSHYSTKEWGKREVEKNQFEDKGRGRIQEVISNIKLVKTHNTQLSEWKFISRTYKKINQIYDKQSTKYHILNFIRNFGLVLIISIIISLSFYKTFQGLLTLGSMVLILQLLNQLRRPLFAMSFILERIQRAEAGSAEYFKIMDLESTETFGSKVSAKKFKKPTIEFDQVSFAYEAENPVLREISFKLDKNETIALVGHSGAGKTTLINLILKFYEPTSGQLKMSGKNYDKLSHQQVRNHISLVFQDNELFSSTVRENVAYGQPQATDKEVVTALKQANAYDFVQKLPGGLEAQIGERGVKLSGGQKQRLQIARAILEDAPILILDEATSSLDSKSEKSVQDALEKLFKNRLVIIIAHRFSTIQNADRIMVLDAGTIVDSGSSKELAQKPGIYSELLRYQVEGNQKLLAQYELY